MGRVIAIDYGAKRCGLAVTDPACIIPGGLATIDTPKLWDYLEEYIKAERVDRIVIGMPMQTNGRVSENQKNISPFIKRWTNAHPDIPIEGWDERYTSVMAHRVIIDAGKGRKARQNKALVDEISATLILESWMSRRHDG